MTMGVEMIEVVVSKLGIDPGTKTYVVVLQEKGAARLLPIWIGQAEAESIVMVPEDEDESEGESYGSSPNLTPDTSSGELSAEQLKIYLEQLRPEDFGKFKL